MKKSIWKKPLAALSAAALGLSFLSGCSGLQAASAAEPGFSQSKSATAAQTLVPEQMEAVSHSAGRILLSVNPEIELEYDQQGLVVEIEGKNLQAGEILLGYEDYVGKDCGTVAAELVERIYQAGYFSQGPEGKDRNIVIKLEAGSLYPDEAFLQDIAQSVQSVAAAHGLSSLPVTVAGDDVDERGYIGLEKAKELALAQMGLAEADFTEREYELDDGVYELEFSAQGVEYEYELDARTGKILEADYENNEDWALYGNGGRDDDDDRYDDDDDRHDDDDDRYDDDDDRHDDDDNRHDDDDDRYDDDDDRYDADDDDRYDDDDDDGRYDD